jgi:serine/threonine protein kinase
LKKSTQDVPESEEGSDETESEPIATLLSIAPNGANPAENCIFDYLFCSQFWNVIPPPTVPLRGGVILMKRGEKVPITLNNAWEVAEGVMKSLRLTHSAKFCHCDIRPSNILKFEDGYQLVDYDLSNPFGTSFRFVPGALFDNRGSRLRDAEVGQDVYWTAEDDYEMLIWILGSIHSPQRNCSVSFQ